MKWLNIHKDGPPDRDRQVLTYSEIYREYQVLDVAIISLCASVTHYAYLIPPEAMEEQRKTRIWELDERSEIPTLIAQSSSYCDGDGGKSSDLSENEDPKNVQVKSISRTE